MNAALIALALATPTPSAEAETLGRRLAETGALSGIATMMTAKETTEMIAAHPELAASDVATLRATAAEVAAAGKARLMTAMGHGYARALTIADLRALVKFNETATARRYRESMPGVIGQAAAAVGHMDFKGETIAAFCRKTGKLCAAPAK